MKSNNFNTRPNLDNIKAIEERIKALSVILDDSPYDILEKGKHYSSYHVSEMLKSKLENHNNILIAPAITIGRNNDQVLEDSKALINYGAAKLRYENYDAAIIPTNLNSYHWVTLVLKKGQNGNITAHYSDNIGAAIPANLKNLLKNVDIHNVIDHKKFRPGGNQDCGPKTIQDSYEIAIHGKLLDHNSEQNYLDVRKAHSETLAERKHQTINKMDASLAMINEDLRKTQSSLKEAMKKHTDFHKDFNEIQLSLDMQIQKSQEYLTKFKLQEQNLKSKTASLEKSINDLTNIDNKTFNQFFESKNELLETQKLIENFQNLLDEALKLKDSTLKEKDSTLQNNYKKIVDLHNKCNSLTANQKEFEQKFNDLLKDQSNIEEKKNYYLDLHKKAKQQEQQLKSSANSDLPRIEKDYIETKLLSMYSEYPDILKQCYNNYDEFKIDEAIKFLGLNNDTFDQ